MTRRVNSISMRSSGRATSLTRPVARSTGVVKRANGYPASMTGHIAG